MSRASKNLRMAVLALALLTLGCAVPLPAVDLTATAESQPRPAAEARTGSGGVRAASAGSLDLSSDDGDTEETKLANEETPTPVATATPRLAQAAPTPLPVSQPENYASDTLSGLNAARNQQGLPSLTPNASLSAAAAAYARSMAQGNFFGHFGPDGSSPRSRISAAGFAGLYKGEALSAGQASPSAALQALLASPSHAAILLEGTSVAAGVGYYYSPASYYKHYWVIMTGNP